MKLRARGHDLETELARGHWRWREVTGERMGQVDAVKRPWSRDCRQEVAVKIGYLREASGDRELAKCR